LRTIPPRGTSSLASILTPSNPIARTSLPNRPADALTPDENCRTAAQFAPYDEVQDVQQELAELEELRDAEADWHLYERPRVKRQIVRYVGWHAFAKRRADHDGDACQAEAEQRLQQLSQEIQYLREQLVDGNEYDGDWRERAEVKHLIIVREDERSALVNDSDSRYRRRAAALRASHEGRPSITTGNETVGCNPSGMHWRNWKPRPRVRRKVSRRKSGGLALLLRLAEQVVRLLVQARSRRRSRSSKHRK
jgi:hypothetical protein